MTYEAETREVLTNPSLPSPRTVHQIGATSIFLVIRLAFLAPEIVTAILKGRQPIELTAEKLVRNSRLPLSWAEQRQQLGFG